MGRDDKKLADSSVPESKPTNKLSTEVDDETKSPSAPMRTTRSSYSAKKNSKRLDRSSNNHNHRDRSRSRSPDRNSVVKRKRGEYSDDEMDLHSRTSRSSRRSKGRNEKSSAHRSSSRRSERRKQHRASSPRDTPSTHYSDDDRDRNTKSKKRKRRKDTSSKDSSRRHQQPNHHSSSLRDNSNREMITHPPVKSNRNQSMATLVIRITPAVAIVTTKRNGRHLTRARMRERSKRKRKLHETKDWP